MSRSHGSVEGRITLMLITAMGAVCGSVPAEAQQPRFQPMSETQFNRQVRELDLSGEALEAARELFDWHRQEVELMEDWHERCGDLMLDVVFEKTMSNGREHVPIPLDYPGRDQLMLVRHNNYFDHLRAVTTRLHEEIDVRYFERLASIASDRESVIDHLRLSWRRERRIMDDSYSHPDGSYVDVLLLAERIAHDIMQQDDARVNLLHWEREVDDLMSRRIAAYTTYRSRIVIEIDRMWRGLPAGDLIAIARNFSEYDRLAGRLIQRHEQTVEALCAILPERADELRDAWHRAKYPFLWPEGVSVDRGQVGLPAVGALRQLRERAARELDALQRHAFDERYLIDRAVRMVMYYRDRSVDVGEDRGQQYHDAAARLTHTIVQVEQRLAGERSEAGQ